MGDDHVCHLFHSPPLSSFSFTPSRNIPVNPVACHGSFEFSHRKPPKSDRERPLPLRSTSTCSFARDRDPRPETLTVIKLSNYQSSNLLSDQRWLPYFAFFLFLVVTDVPASRTLPRLPGQKKNGKGKITRAYAKATNPSIRLSLPQIYKSDCIADRGT